MTEKSLYDKMLERADKDGLPKDHELRTKAVAFKEAIESDGLGKKIFGPWARARRAWCEYTGEPLL